MIHIVCRHYVFMTHVKFLQKTNPMISTGRDLVFLIYLDYQLGFTLSYVRALRSRTLHIYQGLSCLWRHNDARIIIFLVWFHNLFLWDSFHFRNNRLKQTILEQHTQQTFLEQIHGFPPYFHIQVYVGLNRVNIFLDLGRKTITFFASHPWKLF